MDQYTYRSECNDNSYNYDADNNRNYYLGCVISGTIINYNKCVVNWCIHLPIHDNKHFTSCDLWKTRTIRLVSDIAVNDAVTLKSSALNIVRGYEQKKDFCGNYVPILCPTLRYDMMSLPVYCVLRASNHKKRLFHHSPCNDTCVIHLKYVFYQK